MGYKANFLVLKNSPLKHIEDLADKRVSLPEVDSATSWLARASVAESIPLKQSRPVYTLQKFQEAVAYAIKLKVCDAGATGSEVEVKQWLEGGNRVLASITPCDRSEPSPEWYSFEMGKPKEIKTLNASSRAMVLAGALVLTLLPVLLLRTSVAALARGGDGIALVHPTNAMAGLGFVGLWLALVWWGAWSHVSRKPLTGSTRNAQRLGAALVVALVLLGLVAARPLTNVYAKWHGYRRCVAADRFQAGNVPKNDVTLHAYVRLDTTNASLRARCDGATDPTSSR